jgi:hypothetical protein
MWPRQIGWIERRIRQALKSDGGARSGIRRWAASEKGRPVGKGPLLLRIAKGVEPEWRLVRGGVSAGIARSPLQGLSLLCPDS